MLLRRHLRTLHSTHVRGSGHSVAGSVGSMRTTQTISTKPATASLKHPVAAHPHGPPPTHPAAPKHTANASIRATHAVHGIHTTAVSAAGAPVSSRMGNATPTSSGRGAGHTHLNPVTLAAPVISNSPVPLSDEATSIKQPEVCYAAGDKVDGQCTLPNGTKRWYPGIVANVQYTPNTRLIQTVTVKFNDGEEKVFQSLADVRHPKKRRPKGETVCAAAACVFHLSYFTFDSICFVFDADICTCCTT
jgi:hypothetical protein